MLVVHVDNAVVIDRMPNTARGEFRARSRMTARNWVGTWSHPRLLNPFLYPRVAVALWSHKILRWLSPIPLFLLLASIVLMGFLGGPWRWAWLAVGTAIVAIVAGSAAARLGRRIPVCSASWAFVLANAGFARGLLIVARGIRVKTYRNVTEST